jgi:hypothetical protein
MVLDITRLDNMKKQNKSYLPLNKLGIYKAFDKCVVYSEVNDPLYYEIVLFYGNKPFATWAVWAKDYDVFRRDVAVDCCVKYYNRLDLNGRRNSKRITKNWMERTEKKVVERF